MVITAADIERTEKEKRNRVLNVQGISQALKPFCHTFAQNQVLNVRYFKTSKYMYSIYESQSGIKLVLLSSNEDQGYADFLENLYKGAFLDFVQGNVLYE